MDGLFDASFVKDLASSIPGIDEAMSFAEMIKQVREYFNTKRLLTHKSRNRRSFGVEIDRGAP